MRFAGILLSISSLPNEYGIGSMGSEAYEFIDFLAASKQKYWQLLPIGPTSYGDSPYQSVSVFAGNPYFISVELLIKEGLLLQEEADLLKTRNPRRVDYNFLFQTKLHLLGFAYQRKSMYESEFQRFCAEHKHWLEDYSLFMALKKEHHYHAFMEWEEEYRFRDATALNSFILSHESNIDFYRFIQFLFFKQFLQMKQYANEKGILLIGDMPIYCAYDSADVWCHKHYFEVDEKLELIRVAGCPPDAFTEDGQLWGNPLYRYDVMKKDGYQWWVARMKQMEMLFDVVRIDHFRGFAGYYAIEAGAINAKNGKWEKGPGKELFLAIEKECKVKVIAENLGFLTPDVNELLEELKYPGMHIFQFELEDETGCPLERDFEKNSILYTGTHDNQTILSFYRELSLENKKLIDTLCHIRIKDKPNFKIIEFCMGLNPNVCIIPMQDYLSCCDAEGRMNIPSTSLGNWTWRSVQMDYSEELAAYIREITINSGR